MVAAMAGFALEDVLLKQLAASLPVGQVLAMVGAGGGLVFSLIARLGGRPVFSPALLLRPVMLRNLAEATGSTAFICALAFGTLSGASAILQATPLAVTLGAALFLGEPVGWRRWSAICIGFIGVLLIIQPGLAGFTPASLLAVVAVLLMAVRDISSRAVPAQVTSVQVAAWGFLSLVPAGLVVMAIMDTAPSGITLPHLVRYAASLVVGCLGYYALVAATRMGEITAVVPFRYTRLVFALLLGYFVFGERPDALMLAAERRPQDPAGLAWQSRGAKIPANQGGLYGARHRPARCCGHDHCVRSLAARPVAGRARIQRRPGPGGQWRLRPALCRLPWRGDAGRAVRSCPERPGVPEPLGWRAAGRTVRLHAPLDAAGRGGSAR
jgi:drug/metabolite transporter (DMT)-like permease